MLLKQHDHHRPVGTRKDTIDMSRPWSANYRARNAICQSAIAVKQLSDHARGDHELRDNVLYFKRNGALPLEGEHRITLSYTTGSMVLMGRTTMNYVSSLSAHCQRKLHKKRLATVRLPKGAMLSLPMAMENGTERTSFRRSKTSRAILSGIA
jgi:hypothetical protein